MRRILLSILPILLLLGTGEAVGGNVGHQNWNLNAGSEFSGRLLLTPIIFLPLLLVFFSIFLPIGFAVAGFLVVFQLFNAFTVGGLGRDLKSNFQLQAADLAKRALSSEQCVERVACTITNLVPTSYSEPISRSRRRVQSTFKTEEETWKRKMLRGFEAGGQDCSRFNCNLESIFQKKT